MDHLLLNLEIEAACWEFLAQRIFTRSGEKIAQPVVVYLDAMPDEPMRDEDTDPWDELTAECQRIGSGPETVGEMTERMLAKMDV
jgi:hypothetical protein